MAEKLIGACIIGQSGGPSAVINASAYGVIRTALDKVKDWPERDLFLDAADASNNPALRAEAAAARRNRPASVPSNASKL